MAVREFYLKHISGKYLSVKFPDNSTIKPTKNDYSIIFTDTPSTIWYVHNNSNNSYNLVYLKDSIAWYTAYDIEYVGCVSLSYNATEWKLTDGISTCCLGICDDVIKHPIASNNILTIC
jgi:hypothetical protein